MDYLGYRKQAEGKEGGPKVRARQLVAIRLLDAYGLALMDARK